jgi:RHS repeat-associated protein
MEYDAAGNMTRDAVTGGGLRTYDGENRLTAAQGAGGTWFRYVYDADGKRVKRNVGTPAETWMVYGFDGELVAEYAAPNGVNPKPSAPTTEYAYRAGEMLIQADASDCKWLVSDHLGSPRIILGKSGSLADTKRRDFMPFGEDLGAGQFGRTTAQGYEASGTPSNPREKFATYERDDETGLDFAQARYYQSRLGRFTSVDPLLSSGNIYAPQTWNRFSYSLNNPLKYTDSTGMYVFDGSLGGGATDDELKKQKGGQKIIDKRNEFRSALDAARQAASSSSLNKDQQAEVLRAVDAYGKEGDANGVSVGVGSTKKDQAATTDFANGGFTATDDGGFKPNISVVFDENAKIGTETVAHEGSHAADMVEYVRAATSTMSTSQLVGLPQNLTRYATELRAYNVSSYIAQAQDLPNLNIGGYEVWNRGWKQAERDDRRQKNIDKLLKKSSLYQVTPSNPGPRLFEIKE